MTGSWLLCVTASAILSVCIVAARGETCAPPNVPTVVTKQVCAHGTCEDRGFIECRRGEAETEARCR